MERHEALERRFEVVGVAIRDRACGLEAAELATELVAILPSECGHVILEGRGESHARRHDERLDRDPEAELRQLVREGPEGARAVRHVAELEASGPRRDGVREAARGLLVLCEHVRDVGEVVAAAPDEAVARAREGRESDGSPGAAQEHDLGTAGADPPPPGLVPGRSEEGRAWPRCGGPELAPRRGDLGDGRRGTGDLAVEWDGAGQRYGHTSHLEGGMR